jgi:hypothetical protein
MLPLILQTLGCLDDLFCEPVSLQSDEYLCTAKDFRIRLISRVLQEYRTHRDKAYNLDL